MPVSTAPLQFHSANNLQSVENNQVGEHLLMAYTQGPEQDRKKQVLPGTLSGTLITREVAARISCGNSLIARQ